jgi:hypothetical protein
MSDFKRIENFDTIILDQISEEQIAAWMAAKLCIMRKTLPVSCVSITANFRDYRNDDHYDVNWGAHAADKCTGIQPDTKACMDVLKQELLDNPKKRAEMARWKAKELLKEATELEALAVG